MLAEGFQYAPDVAFPEEAVRALAESLGVYEPNAGPSDFEPPHEINAAYLAGLSPAEAERFHQALFGESESDIVQMRESGLLPSGRGEDFGGGGCIGEANVSIPGIWALGRELAGELEEVRTRITEAPEFDEASARYTACTEQFGLSDVDGPMALDYLLADGTIDAQQAETVATSCGAIWADAYGEAESRELGDVQSRHAAEFDQLEDSYRDVMEAIASDQDFLDHLRATIVLIVAADADH